MDGSPLPPPNLFARLRQSVFIERPVLGVGLSSLVSLGFCVLSFWAIARNPGASSLLRTLLLLTIWIASFCVAAASIAYAIFQSFRADREHRSRLATILTAYAAITVVFAGLYLAIAFLGDYGYAQAEYEHYHAEGVYLKMGRIAAVRPFEPVDRAFTGVKASLWTTLRTEPLPPFTDPGAVPQLLLVRAQRPPETIVRFDRNAVVPAFFDYLHLSVMTIATVGYGNIAPVYWQAKLASNAEALAGLALLGVAFGMLLSDWGAARKASS